MLGVKKSRALALSENKFQSMLQRDLPTGLETIGFCSVDRLFDLLPGNHELLM
jgi:hypothetical protein